MNKYFNKKNESSSHVDDKTYSNHYKIGAIALLLSFIGAGGKYIYNLYRLRTKKSDEENNKVRIIV